MDGSFPPSSQASTTGRLLPRQPVPALRLPLLAGGIFDLSAQTPPRFSMIVFYRGLHCPVCTTYLRELERLHGEFVSRGIDVLVASSDTAERAAAAQEKWGLPSLTMAHSLPISVARQWGLYVSTSRGRSTSGVEEPPVFSEPGVFVVKPDATLYWASVQTMPFARPHFNEMVQAFDLVQRVDYPARGEA
jgi:peroxiredoxin